MHKSTISKPAGIPFALFAMSSLLLSGCGFQEPRWQTYEEINEKPSAPGHTHSESVDRPPVAKRITPKPLRWTAPEGWSEQPGSGMRIATFTTGSGDQSATCTVISLSGTAGGLEANVRRWIGQLKLEMPDTETLASFLERQKPFQSEGGLEGIMVDMLEWGPASDGTSMLAALVAFNEATLFIKLTGPLEFLAGEKERFLALCRSLRTEA